MSGAYFVLLWLLCGAVFVTDLLFRRVPNRLLIAVLLAWSAIQVVDSAGLSVGATIPLRDSLIGASLSFVFLLPFYIFRAMGAGDVKCFAVLGLLLGPVGAIWVWLVASALVGVHALIGILAAGVRQDAAQVVAISPTGWPRSRRFAEWIREKRQGRQGLPYAAYMGVAALGQFYWINARI